MGKIVIYTCITGNYDSVKQPVQAPENFDFILFVEKGTKHTEYDGIWKIEELPVRWEDKLLTSRFPKICPHSLLQNYEYSFWVDGNIRIANTEVYDRCLELAKRGVQYAGIEHRLRDCAYDECNAVLKCDKDKFSRLMKVVTFLGKSHLEPHAGLMENCIIFRRHNHPTVEKFDKLWWNRFVSVSPRRDQLVHTVCLKDVPELEWCWFDPGYNRATCGLFEYTVHPTERPHLNFFQKKWKYGILYIQRLILSIYVFIMKHS